MLAVSRPLLTLKHQSTRVQHQSAATAPIPNGRQPTHTTDAPEERPPVTALPVVRIEGQLHRVGPPNAASASATTSALLRSRSDLRSSSATASTAGHSSSRIRYSASHQVRSHAVGAPVPALWIFLIPGLPVPETGHVFDGKFRLIAQLRREDLPARDQFATCGFSLGWKRRFCTMSPAASHSSRFPAQPHL